MANDQDQEPQLNTAAIDDHNKTVKIKLKIPKTASVEGKKSSLSPCLPDNNSTSRVCEECGKIFCSGKALGGHRRSHVQAAKKEALKIKKAVVINESTEPCNGFPADDKTTTAAVFLVSGPITCSLCNNGRTFATIKGLYGHMRSHPERDWRGINPPEKGTHSPASTISDDQDQIDAPNNSVTDADHHIVNLMGSLKGWPSTAKRGRSGFACETSGSRSGSGFNDDEELMQEAVNDLLMLSFGRPIVDCASSSKNHGDQIHKGKFPLGGVKIDESCHLAAERSELSGVAKDKGKGKAVFEAKGLSLPKKEAFEVTKAGDWRKTTVGAIRKGEMVLDKMDKSKGKDGAKFSKKMGDNSVLKDYDQDDHTEVETDRKMKKRRKLADLEKVGELVGTIPYKHTCNNCNKSFSTPKALAGHMACHFRCKNVNNAKQLSNANFKVKVVKKEVCEEAAHKHQCEICNKSFPTGQALGGHKRGHWVNPSEAPSPLSQVTSSAGEVNQTARGVLNFDLNLPAPLEEDDDNDQGAAYA